MSFRAGLSRNLKFREDIPASPDTSRTMRRTLTLCCVCGTRRCGGAVQLRTELLADLLHRKLLRYDESGEQHSLLDPALDQSVRNSHPDGALSWFFFKQKTAYDITR